MVKCPKCGYEPKKFAVRCPKCRTFLLSKETDESLAKRFLERLGKKEGEGVVDGQVLVKERFETHKAKMVKHLDNEMRLTKEFMELKPRLSAEQLQELMVTMATHPHAKTAEKLDEKEIVSILEQLKKIREEKRV